MTESTYSSAVRSFDHAELAKLDTYQQLREALSDVANEADVPLGDFLAAVQDMAATAPYADCCNQCRDDTMSWPHRVDREDRQAGSWLKCHYRCARCGHRWTCGYNVDLINWL